MLIKLFQFTKEYFLHKFWWTKDKSLGMKFTNNNLVLMLRMEWKSEGVQPHRKRFRERGEASKQPSNSLLYFYRISMSTSVGIWWLSSILSFLNECTNVKKLICNLFFTKVLFMIKKASHKTLLHQCPVTFKILNNKFNYWKNVF